MSKEREYDGMPRIELLGIGSSKHRQLKANLQKALKELSLDIPIEEVTDIDELMRYEIAGIPALAVNGQVLFQQVVPSVEDLSIVLKVLLSGSANQKEEMLRQAAMAGLNQKGNPMKNILVPTDFSRNAESAILYAIEIANKFGSKITLLNTYKVYSSAGMFLSVESYMEKDAAEQMLATLNRLEPLLKGNGSIESKIVRGDAVPVITDLAEKGDYSLIIMGTQGASGLKEIFTGSITNGVMKNTRTPVLAIPGDYHYRPIDTIVFAVDEEGISHPGVTSVLVKIAKAFDASVHVFHQDLGSRDDGIDPTVDIFLDGIDHSFHYELDEQNINESINGFVEDYKANLLCMVRRRRGFLEEAFHVSATTREVFNSPVPLLILHDEG
ncbi:MAG: universal stress protein [Phaeodactylibacter sp.]|nr:universal stress protein [Phaeodactylibacter sp.]MCB9264073.1 universal stress protein [Lewinellaceae bacterium]MCB9289852.1 universal stress protein [Lewinellaceae bacterium]